MRNFISHFKVVIAAAALVTQSVQGVSAGQRPAVPGGPAPTPSTPVASASESAAMDVLGDERLAWDQRASTPQELAGFGFVAYVNGQLQALSSVSCAQAQGPAGFECTSALPALEPGLNAIEVATYVVAGARAEGRRSAPIHLRFGGSTAGVVRGSALREQGSAAQIDRTWTTTDGVRVRATAIATGLDDATDLLPLPDGRVLIAERAGRVRVFRDGVLLAAAAAVLDDVVVGEFGGLLSLAVDRAFSSTRHVFATYTTADGLRVVRFTAAGDRLVDRAVLLEALPVAAARPAALLRSGPDGRLYLALDDRGDRHEVLDMGSYSGKVLRFATDGTIPDDQPGQSPVWSVGVSHPVGLAWSTDRATLRLVGVEPRDVALPQASLPEPDSGRKVSRFSLEPALGASSAAIGAGHGFHDDLLIASAVERAVLRVWLSAGDVPGGSEWLLRELPDPITALAVDADGVIYAAVGPMLLRVAAE